MYEIVVGRDEEDRKAFGNRGTFLIGKHYVKMGQTTSLSSAIYMDVLRSHVVSVFGKRGSGKSYTISAIAEGMMGLEPEFTRNLSVVMFDTMGIFWTMKFPNKREDKLLEQWNLKPRSIDVHIYTPIGCYNDYKNRGIPTDYPFAIKPTELSAGEWCNVFEIKMTDPIGVLIEKVISELKESKKEYSIKEIVQKIEVDAKTEKNVKDAAENRFIAADSWGLFSEKGIEISEILKPGTVNIIDVNCYTSISRP